MNYTTETIAKVYAPYLGCEACGVAYGRESTKIL